MSVEINFNENLPLTEFQVDLFYIEEENDLGMLRNFIERKEVNIYLQRINLMSNKFNREKRKLNFVMMNPRALRRGHISVQSKMM